MEGQLLKFTNVMKGYQFRWVVIDSDNGLLEYYEKEEHKRVFKPRGSINLLYATVCPSDEDSQTFIVNASTGESVRLRAIDAKERQVWVNCIRSVAEYQLKIAGALQTSSLTTSQQLMSLLPGKDRQSSLSSDSNFVSTTFIKSAKSNDSSSRFLADRRYEPTTPNVSGEEVGNANSADPVLIDPCQQLNRLFCLLDREGNNLANEIDELYSPTALAFTHRNPEVTEAYKNLLILKATSQGAIKSLKRCVLGLQFGELIATSHSEARDDGTLTKKFNQSDVSATEQIPMET